MTNEMGDVVRTLRISASKLESYRWEVSLFTRPKVFRHKPHRHEGFMELTYVRRGMMTHWINGLEIRQTRGDLALIRESDFHALAAGVDLEYANLAFLTAWFPKPEGLPYRSEDNIFSLLRSSGPILGHVPTTEQAAFERVLYGLIQAKDSNRDAAQFLGLLYGVIGRFLHGPVKTTTTSQGRDERMPAWLENFLTRIEPFPETMHTGKELATQCERTREHVARCFRKYLGTSVSAFLIARRLQYARQLLVSTDLPVKAVALKAGFPNLGHFYECFRAEFGMAPGRLQRQASIADGRADVVE